MCLRVLSVDVRIPWSIPSKKNPEIYMMAFSTNLYPWTIFISRIDYREKIVGKNLSHQNAKE